MNKYLTLIATAVLSLATYATVTQGPGASPNGNAVSLQGRAVSSTAPTDAFVLTWDAATNTWKPAAAASISTPISIANGGTNKALTLSAGGVPYFDADSFEVLAAGSSGKVLTSGGAGAPTWQTPATGAPSDGVTGSVQLSDGAGAFTSEGSLLFWDAANNRLGLGINAPTRDLEIASAGEPTIMFNATAAAANTKKWQYTVSGGSWYVQPLTDLGAGDTALALARNQGTATTATWSQSYISCTALTTNGGSVMGCTASDERLKKDIVPFERGLEAIAGLTPKSFKFKDPMDYNIEHSGFIAQNVAKFIPEAVRIGIDGYMQLDYWTIVATQANAINELRMRLEALEGPKAQSKKAIPMKPVVKLVSHAKKFPPQTQHKKAK